MDKTVRELNRDLAGKFKSHGSRVEQRWRSFGQEQREKILRVASRDGLILKDRLDRSLGNVYKIIPEWNLHDITSPSSDFLLDILKHRATTPLPDQYTSGINGGPGDHAHIVDMIERKDLKVSHASEYKNCYNLFIDEETYGQSFQLTPEGINEYPEGLPLANETELVIPRAIGELVLLRQMYLLQCLNIAIEDILDTASTTHAQTKRPKKLADVATAALAALSSHLPPKKPELSHLIDSSHDQKSSMEDYINLICAEPTVLAHEVNRWFFTRPELVADKQGHTLPFHTDKYISEAVFDVIHSAVKVAAVWNYISCLLDLLNGSSDEHFQVIVLQELSNMYHLEYTRAQAIFKRNVSTGSGGNKWFKRINSVQKDDPVRVSMKRNPKSLRVVNPQLYYTLELCQNEATWSRSAE